MTARFVVGALAVLWTAPGCAGADPGRAGLVAIVTEVEGSARLIVRGRTQSPEVAGPVEQGAIVTLERDARIVLTYPLSGLIYELQGPGRFLVHREAVQASTGSGRLARRELVPALRALRIRPDGTTLQGSAAMRGASESELQAEGPRGTQLAPDAIHLCWRSLGSQWTYRVHLIDDDGNVLFEARTSDSTFELPDTVQLQANVPYLWHLQATGANGQLVDAAGQFQRLDPGTEQALRAAESLSPELDATGRALLRIARQQQGIAPGGARYCSRDRALNASDAPASE